MKLQMFGPVGRATVPAETGRHGGRPYDSTRSKFLFRFDWTLAARGDAHMKLQGMTNDECRLTNGGIASLSLFKIGRIHYSMLDVERSMFNVH
jgi:hypothetical protein